MTLPLPMALKHPATNGLDDLAAGMPGFLREKGRYPA